MDGNKVSDVIHNPKIQACVTGFFCWLGLTTPEAWLTFLSICAVLAQLFIASPKIFDTIAEWKRRLRVWFKKDPA